MVKWLDGAMRRSGRKAVDMATEHKPAGKTRAEIDATQFEKYCESCPKCSGESEACHRCKNCKHVFTPVKDLEESQDTALPFERFWGPWRFDHHFESQHPRADDGSFVELTGTLKRHGEANRKAGSEPKETIENEPEGDFADELAEKFGVGKYAFKPKLLREAFDKKLTAKTLQEGGGSSSRILHVYLREKPSDELRKAILDQLHGSVVDESPKSWKVVSNTNIAHAGSTRWVESLVNAGAHVAKSNVTNPEYRKKLQASRLTWSAFTLQTPTNSVKYDDWKSL